jgi:thiamine-phosphate pyrophosphorylase
VVEGVGREPVPRPAPRLIALTDRTRAGPAETLERFGRIARAARPGSVLFQLRDRELSGAERLGFGRELAELVRREGQLLAVNDRLDLAVLLGADAVHLGEASVTTADARALVGAAPFLTRACHDPERALAVEADGLLLSPVLAPRKGRPALGLPAVAQLKKALAERGKATLLYALGGIDAGSARACLEAGADGVAVLGAVLEDALPERIVEALGCGRP